MTNARASRIRELANLTFGLPAGGLCATFGLRPVAATEASGASAGPLDVGAIFRDREDDPRTFYWMVVKGKGDRPVEQSQLPLDKIHLTHVRSALDKTPRTTLSTEMDLVPRFITQVISEHEARRERDG